ncbi:hypothetical protein [Nitrospira moscoviensis]|uniref:Uncharacterized protein n=1 Tax=Nitrospira moscoviensis TaxID=42253 RepID=A0A0K2G799_NITMO|nr:hypothetical protein [Nitrospira moscoviensis]ALA56833.1 hypothetical protein NITMOv2_0397 [Nitrospira moscoviensis]
MATAQPNDTNWPALEAWWGAMSRRLQVADRAEAFFAGAKAGRLFDRIAQVGGQLDYVLFVLMRYWVPTVLPPAGRERLTKNDPDYWIESEQILKAAAARLRQLKPLIELLATPSPLSEAPPGKSGSPSPVAELELSGIIEGIAEAAGSYGGPDYTSIVKAFDPVPLRQTQPFKHNKKHSAELWVVFLLREHFRSLGLGKDRYWPLVAPLCTAAGILNQNGQAYSPDELKAWWQKNWPRTYQQLEQKQEAADSGGAAYEQDFQWFQAWMAWQRSRPA